MVRVIEPRNVHLSPVTDVVGRVMAVGGDSIVSSAEKQDMKQGIADLRSVLNLCLELELEMVANRPLNLTESHA